MYIYLQLCSMISLIIKTSMFTLSATKCFKIKYYANGNCYCKRIVERKKCWLITKIK
jgi:hypothetical protein